MAPVQSAANSRYAAMMNTPTYTSFMPIRLWTNSMPSNSARNPTAMATARRRNRIRPSR